MRARVCTPSRPGGFLFIDRRKKDNNTGVTSLHIRVGCGKKKLRDQGYVAETREQKKISAKGDGMVGGEELSVRGAWYGNRQRGRSAMRCLGMGEVSGEVLGIRELGTIVIPGGRSEERYIGWLAGVFCREQKGKKLAVAGKEERSTHLR
ncbi:hypothetical protein ABZP36_008419 [Zizania latifolia]